MKIDREALRRAKVLEAKQGVRVFARTLRLRLCRLHRQNQADGQTAGEAQRDEETSVHPSPNKGEGVGPPMLLAPHAPLLN